MTGEGGGETSSTVSGGTVNGPVLQGRDFYNPTFVTSQAAAAPVALAQLPPLAAGFTGREGELAQMAGLLDPATGTGAVVVSAVTGLAGVGKTALAVYAAHAALKAGWFPGGVLFIDLHGYDEKPVQHGQALDALLRALGVPGEHIPEGAELRAGLYRSALAQIKDPVLVIADNASAEAQVRLLIPGPGPHRMIVTSRHTLAGLGARLLDVTVLDQAAAVQLLDTVLRAGRPDDDRISSDPAAAGRLAGACGGLPLALQITAALLVADPALTAAELAEEMADEVRRLGALRYDDGSGVRAPSVAAAFELSYRQLDGDAALMFRLLPADPASDISTDAAAALAGWTSAHARAVFGRLAKAHLVETVACPPGRWQMHDLLRLYARQIADEGERDQAIERLLAWYYHHANAADAHLRALPGMPVPAEFNGREDALAWLDAQRPNLVAAVALAASTDRAEAAMRLPIVLGPYLDWRRRFDDILTVLTISRDSARHLGDRKNEASALAGIGIGLERMKRFEDAIGVLQDAAAIFRESGDRRDEGKAIANLAQALAAIGRFEDAASACREDLAICRELGDRHGEGGTLNNLGLVLAELGRLEDAIVAHQNAAAICRETGDRHGEGLAWNNLGIALQKVGRVDDAIGALREDLAICRELGDRHGEGVALDNLGQALRETGLFEDAVSAHHDAAAIYRETDDRHGEGTALDNLASAYQEMQQPDRAAACWQEAAAAMRDAGDDEEAARLEHLAANTKAGQRS